jgi:hypothetical protein
MLFSFGRIKGSFVSIAGAGTEIVWRRYFPNGYGVYPTFYNGWETVMVIFTGFIFLLLSYTHNIFLWINDRTEL